MRAVMTAHVDKFGSLLYSEKRGFHHGFGFSCESHHSAVCGFSGVHIKQTHTVHRTDSVGNLTYYVLVASLAEIGDTFYNAFYHGVNII